MPRAEAGRALGQAAGNNHGQVVASALRARGRDDASLATLRDAGVDFRSRWERFAADCEANWLRETEPATWGKVRHYLGLSGFLTHRLVGRFVDSTAAQVGYLPFDNRHFAWAGPRDWKWTVAPVERAWLPDLVPPTGPLGEITAAAAAHTGLPEGLPVIAAAADKACEVLGFAWMSEHQRRALVRVLRDEVAHTADRERLLLADVQATPWLDGAHTGFGKVVGGQDVVDALGTTATGPGPAPRRTMAPWMAPATSPAAPTRVASRHRVARIPDWSGISCTMPHPWPRPRVGIWPDRRRILDEQASAVTRPAATMAMLATASLRAERNAARVRLPP